MPKHSIEEIRAEYDRLDALCNADSSDIEIKISERLTRYSGFCHHRKVQGRYVTYKITIAAYLLDCDDGFWDTIRHEYAHFLVTSRDGKKHSHDSVWKAACAVVGCRPERCQKDKDANAKALESMVRNAKYRVRCKDCKRSWYYLRAGAVVKALEANRTCTCPCGSKKLVLQKL